MLGCMLLGVIPSSFTIKLAADHRTRYYPRLCQTGRITGKEVDRLTILFNHRSDRNSGDSTKITGLSSPLRVEGCAVEKHRGSTPSGITGGNGQHCGFHIPGRWLVMVQSYACHTRKHSTRDRNGRLELVSGLLAQPREMPFQIGKPLG